MKRSLLGKPLWQRSDQFHPKLWDVLDYGLGYYPITKYKQMRRASEYIFKEHRHKHLSNNR